MRGALIVEHLLAQVGRRIALGGEPLEIQQMSDPFDGARTTVATHPDVTIEVILIDRLAIICRP